MVKLSERLSESLLAATRQLAEVLGLSSSEARFEARILVAHALAADRAWLIAHADDPLTEAQLAAFESLLTRRAQGEPVAYILGEREFYGRPFKVTPATLIPRPETEHLVEAALARLPTDSSARVLDIGAGSGCIAITLGLERPQCKVTAVDISPAALATARDNAVRLGARVECLESDLYAALPDCRFDLIVSNPPYVADTDAHLERGDLRFEPRDALASGAEGLDAIRAIVGQAPSHLAPGGWLLLEHGWDQSVAVGRLLADAGFTEIFLERDLAGQPRVSGGRCP